MPDETGHRIVVRASPLDSKMTFNGFIAGFGEFVRSLADLGEVAVQEFKSAAPANWDQLTIPAIERVCRLMVRTGCNLAWVPRAELVDAVVSTNTRPPLAILAQHEAELIDDIHAALAAIEVPAMTGPVRAAIQAVNALAGDELYNAQATASVVLTHVVHDLGSARHLAPARRRLAALDLERATIIDLRRRTVRRLIADAITPADFDAPGPYRRSASLHGISDGQYTRENAIAALLLMVGALCELREELLAPDVANARRWAMGLPRRYG